jgi:uncharacterized Zn-binding protein involved in type VI secretion
MGQPAAKKGDSVIGMDTHVLLVPSPAGPVPTPTPMPFVGALDGALSTTTFVQGQCAATASSTASNAPAHLPTAGPFQRPPSNKATIDGGSATVFIGGKPAARSGDAAVTCNDPSDAAKGTIVARGTVFVG